MCPLVTRVDRRAVASSPRIRLDCRLGRRAIADDADAGRFRFFLLADGCCCGGAGREWRRSGCAGAGGSGGGSGT